METLDSMRKEIYYQTLYVRDRVLSVYSDSAQAVDHLFGVDLPNPRSAGTPNKQAGERLTLHATGISLLKNRGMRESMIGWIDLSDPLAIKNYVMPRGLALRMVIDGKPCHLYKTKRVAHASGDLLNSLTELGVGGFLELIDNTDWG